MEIKDSGNRREFESGAVRDMAEGKGRMDLLPWSAIMEVSKHCENGALKYGEHNVDKGLPTHSFVDSAFRHLAKYVEGWDDEPHLLASAWNLLWAIQMEIKHPEMVDTPWDRKKTKTLEERLSGIGEVSEKCCESLKGLSESFKHLTESAVEQ